MVLTPEDAKIMREYLDRGGFWMLDDFWGSFEWGNMAAEMKKVLPNAEIQNIPLNHPHLSSVLRRRSSEAGAQSCLPQQWRYHA